MKKSVSCLLAIGMLLLTVACAKNLPEDLPDEIESNNEDCKESNDINEEKIDTSEIMPGEVSDTYNEQADTEKRENNEEVLAYKEMTMSDIRILAQAEEITITDFDIYANRIVDDQFANTSNEFYDNFSYVLQHEGQSFRLYVSYAIFQNKIRSVFLYNESIEPAQRVDIRTGLIDEVINADVSMSDYALYHLPNGVTEGEFSIYLGYYGGQEFLYENEIVGGFNFTYAQDLRPRISGNELVGIDWVSGDISYIESETIEEPDVPCMLCLQYNSDTGKQSWCAYFCVPNAQIGFALELDDSIFDKEDILDILKDISFISTAFV